MNKLDWNGFLLITCLLIFFVFKVNLLEDSLSYFGRLKHTNRQQQHWRCCHLKVQVWTGNFWAANIFIGARCSGGNLCRMTFFVSNLRSCLRLPASIAILGALLSLHKLTNIQQLSRLPATVVGELKNAARNRRAWIRAWLCSYWSSSIPGSIFNLSNYCGRQPWQLLDIC